MFLEGKQIGKLDDSRRRETITPRNKDHDLLMRMHESLVGFAELDKIANGSKKRKRPLYPFCRRCQFRVSVNCAAIDNNK